LWRSPLCGGKPSGTSDRSGGGALWNGGRETDAAHSATGGVRQDEHADMASASGGRGRQGHDGAVRQHDDTCFFGTPLEGRPGNSGEAVDRYVDVRATPGVRVLLVCTNRAAHQLRSAVWDAYWDAVWIPSDRTTSLSSRPSRRSRSRATASWWTICGRCTSRAVDYPARMLARGLLRGMQAWITRCAMNDVHRERQPGAPVHGRFFTGTSESFVGIAPATSRPAGPRYAPPSRAEAGSQYIYPETRSSRP